MINRDDLQEFTPVALAGIAALIISFASIWAMWGGTSWN
jgi:hypothetical protein